MDLLRNIGLLRHFLVVAREGNVTAAAQRLGISQPALTKSIRRLEEECGAPLFDRHTRGVSLTLYGKALLRHARLIDTECRFATSEIEALRHGQPRSAQDRRRAILGRHALAACGRPA